MKFLSALSERLRDGLRRSQEYLAGSLGTVLDTDRPVDDALLEELEELLIAADLGASLAADFVNRAREEVMFGTVTRASQLRPLFRRFLLDTLAPVTQPLNLEHHPAVVLLLGVNGSGKTTTAAKLAASLKGSGKRVILAAADTFRAAAIEQLERWGERIQVEVIRQAAGSDPAAVVFDAVKAATARDLDVLIVDTAGRLHTKTNLMDELAKLRRVIERQLPGAPHETLDGPRRADGPERIRPGPDVPRSDRPHGRLPDQARRHRQGRDRHPHRPRAQGAREAHRAGRELEDLQPFDAQAFVDALVAEA